uniref:Uncharacterized protein n=1 Tax=Panagrolaimus superbus TaxID=310955 RepID=A0A914Z324_9BILA
MLLVNQSAPAESKNADEEAADVPSPNAVPEEPHPLAAGFKKCGAPQEAIDALTAPKIPCNGWLKDAHWASECDCSSSNVSEHGCYASEDGPISNFHADADPILNILDGLERVHAACATSEVVRMVFRYNQVIIKMDTREAVCIPSGVTHLADFLKVAKAASRLALVFATTRDDVINADPRLWTDFTSNTSLIAISGTLHPIELWRLIKCVKNPAYLNVLNQKFLNNASLVDFARFLEPNITHFMFDTRYTCNSSLIENVMALYGDLFMRQRGNRPCFKKLLLIVTDFCNRRALQTQLCRLCEMLLDGEDCSATILTTMPGDNALVDTLVIQGFKRGRGGYLQTLDHKYEKYDHWVSSSNGKTVVIGFRDPRVAPIPEDYGVPL